MKTGWTILTAFIGGAVLGTTAGLLFAPEKGENQRRKIKETLDKYGIKLGKDEFNCLVDDIKSINNPDDNPAVDLDAE
jgi:gas vesicle protein